MPLVKKWQLDKHEDDSDVHHRKWGWWDEWGWKRTLFLPICESNGWKKYANNPIFEKSGAGWDSALVAYPAVIFVGGVYYLFYEGNNVLPPPWEMGGVGVAKGSSPYGPFTRSANNPLLVPTGVGTDPDYKWDAYTPMVIYDELESDPAKRWKMWYDTKDQVPNYKVMYAYASDPEGPWTKVGACTGLPNVNCSMVGILRIGNIFYAFGRYSETNFHVYTAKASQPQTFTDRGSVLSGGGAGAWDSTYINFMTLFFNMGIIYVFYSGYYGRWRIGASLQTLAGLTSTYSKLYSNPVLDVGSAGAWDDDDVLGPSLLAKDGTFHMYYTGRRSDNEGRIGVATIP